MKMSRKFSTFCWKSGKEEEILDLISKGIDTKFADRKCKREILSGNET
jgi:hypothetical protein